MIVMYKMEKVKSNLYLLFKILICLYILLFLFSNMSILFFSETLLKYTIFKIDWIFQNSSPETIVKLQEILNKYSITINYIRN